MHPSLRLGTSTQPHPILRARRPKLFAASQEAEGGKSRVHEPVNVWDMRGQSLERSQWTFQMVSALHHQDKITSDDHVRAASHSLALGMPIDAARCGLKHRWRLYLQRAERRGLRTPYCLHL